MLRQAAPSDEAYRAAVHAFVKAHVRFEPEEGELFQNGGVTLGLGVGDCDDHARLIYALYIAGGLGAQLGFLHRGAGASGPTHAAALGCVDGACAWAETTVDARLGEHPLAAAMRLGVINQRSDIAKEVRIMGDGKATTIGNMGPPPGRYVDVNRAHFARDVAALKTIGLLAPCTDPVDPADRVFREAILALQLLSGDPAVVKDGLVGPQSRALMAARLPPVDAASYVGAIEGSTVKYTGDLSEGFFRAVVALNDHFVKKGAKTTPEMWLAVWNGESGLRASARNAAGYGGLNGLNGKYLASVGFGGSFVDWLALSAEEQVPFVQRFYDSIGGFMAGNWDLLDSPEAIYAWNWLPAIAVSRMRSGAPFAAKLNDPHRWYKDNAVLDRNNDGEITLDDLRAWVGHSQRSNGARWIEARRRLHEAGGAEPGSPMPIAGLVTGGILLAAGVAAALYANA